MSYYEYEMIDEQDYWKIETIVSIATLINAKTLKPAYQSFITPMML